MLPSESRFSPTTLLASVSLRLVALFVGALILFGAGAFAQDGAAGTVAPTEEEAKAEAAAKAAKARQEASEKFEAGFARLQFIKGSWIRAAASPGKAGAPEGAAPKTLAITPYMGGKYLETHGNLGGVDFQIIFSYYQPENHYIMSIVDDKSGVLDVYHGDFDADGSLVFTNSQFFRVSLVPLANGNFRWIGAHSRDQGASWKVTNTFDLQRAP